MANVKHTTVAVGSNNPDKQISVDAWNDDHEITGTPGALLGFDGSGVATDITEQSLGIHKSVADRAALAALSTDVTTAFLKEANRSGNFVFDSSDLSALVAADPAQGIYVPPASDPTGASGAWVRQLDGVLNVKWFGAVGDGITDDGAALQAFNDWFFAEVRPEFGDFTGEFASSQTINIGPVAAGSHNDQHFNVGGELKVVAIAALEKIINLKELDQTVWRGRITAFGTGDSAFSSRTCGIGIYASGCSNAVFTGGLRAYRVLYHGVYFDSTGGEFNDCVNVAALSATYCGSGPVNTPSQCLTANWSAPVNTGGSASTLQSTTLTVDALPPTLLDNYEAWGDKQAVVVINGEPYRIKNIDRVASTVTVFPWVDGAVTAAGAGTLTYLFGAGFATKGGDSGIIRIGHAELLNNGIGIGEAALYGSIIESGNCTSNGIGVCVGAVGAAHFGSDFAGVYTEGNSFDLVWLASTASSNYFLTNHTLDISKCWALTGPRDATGVFSGNGPVFGPFTLGVGGKLYTNQQETILSTPTGTGMNALNVAPRFYNANNFTIGLTNVSNGQWNRLFGYRGGVIWVFSSGQLNDAPSGTITVNPPNYALANCTTTNGSAVVTVPLAGQGTKGLVAGMPVAGTGIPAGATVLTVDSRTQFTLSAAATASGTVTATFTGSVNGAFAATVFRTFNGPVGINLVHTDRYEMQWSVRIFAGQLLPQTVETVAGLTYAPVLTDHGKLKRMTNNGAKTITLPSDATTAFATGQWIDFVNEGTSAMTFAAGAAATIVSRGARLSSAGQYSRVRAEKTTANTWLLDGDLA